MSNNFTPLERSAVRDDFFSIWRSSPTAHATGTSCFIHKKRSLTGRGAIENRGVLLLLALQLLTLVNERSIGNDSHRTTERFVTMCTFFVMRYTVLKSLESAVASASLTAQ